MDPRFPLKRDVDFSEFLKVLKREGTPAYLPFYEHVYSPMFVSTRTGTEFYKLTPDDDGYWETRVDFILGMGYDCFPMEIPPYLPTPEGHVGAVSEESEAKVCIRSWEDFEKYPWPSLDAPLDFSHFEKVAGLLPSNVKIVGGVCAGPYEWASGMMGTIGMSYLMADEPELVEAVFEKIGSIHHAAVKQLATMDCVGALRQGDDLGFKTSTFLSPNQLRQLVFPTYKKMVAEAHANGKPFILHSCGNLTDVYEDLIADVKIDAKHSFEDIITPVEVFKKQYEGRVTPLGGLDVDFICRHSEDEIRAYTRSKIEQCFYDGYWALGTGNSLTDYMPVENYIAVLDEGMTVLAS